MARKLIRLPFRLSRMILRLLSAVIAFVFTFFVYASGQVVKAQTQFSGAKSALSKTSAQATSGVDAPVPAYGISPLYGVMEYGMPSADFSVKGVLRSDKTGQPIPGIQVILQDTVTKEFIDTLTTSSDGTFAFVMTGRLPTLNTWLLTAEDVDGTANGSFVDKDTLLSIPSDSLKGGSGFFAGSAEANIAMYLHDNATQVLPREGGVGNRRAVIEARLTGDGCIAVECQLPFAGDVRLGMYDADGRLVANPTQARSQSGRFTATLSSASLAPGIYYLKLAAGSDVVISQISVAR